MPVWNRAEVVGRAIQSVLCQTFPDYELLIIDDGSEDDLGSAVAPFLSPTVTLHRIAHKGVSAARNHGISRARGHYIAYLDSDNVWSPRFLERMARALREHPDCRGAYCMLNVLKKDALSGERAFVRNVGAEFSYLRLVRENFIDMNALVHAKQCVDHAGTFDEDLERCVDWEFVLRLAGKYRLRFVPEALVDYYLGDCANAITLTRDDSTTIKTIQRRHRMHTPVIRLVHDAVEYTWSGISEEKYHNWVLMNNTTLDTDEYRAWGYPYMLQIEPTSQCNLSCSLCPTGRKELNRPYRHMRLGEFQALIDDMERYLLFLILWDWGEPLMNPELPAMIRYAADRGIKTVTSTNAYCLNDEAYTEELLGAGLSTLIVAVDSIDPARYEVYRRHGTLDRVLEGLKTAVAVKRRMRSGTLINVRMVVMKQNEHEVDAIEHQARLIGADVFTVKTLNPSCGVVALDEDLLPLNPKYRRYEYVPRSYERVRANAECRRIWMMSNVFSNGDVVPCCYDYDSSMKVGNAFETPLTTLWNAPGYRALRKRVLQDLQTFPKCAHCGVNFKLSETGWFARATDLRQGTPRSNLLPGVVPLYPEELDAVRLGELLKEKEDEIARLRSRIDTMESTLGWRALWRLRAVRNAVLPMPLYLKIRNALIKDSRGS